jgi:hypothetical protein
MSARRRRLLMGGRDRVVDDFAALSSRWVVQNDGTLSVSGGAVRASALDNWGPQLVADSGIEEWSDENTPSVWTKSAAGVIEREDSDVHTGSHCVALTQDETGTSGRPFLYQTVPLLVGATYFGSLWAKRVDAIGCRVALIDASSSWYPISRDDPALSWTMYSGAAVPHAYTHIAKGAKVYLSDSVPVTVLVDDINIYRRNTPALLAGWRSPNHIATLSHVSPAAAVTPFGYLCRYTDALNYWEVRVLPNTAGNDLQIIQVTAGAETTRAQADIDWTSDDTDELEVTCSGSTISTAYRKSGASVWTAGPSYGSATQGQTSPDVGLMLYEASVGRVSSFEIRAA